MYSKSKNLETLEKLVVKSGLLNIKQLRKLENDLMNEPEDWKVFFGKKISPVADILRKYIK